MDATRKRRTADPARQRWYARWRALRFARRFFRDPAAEIRSANRLNGLPTNRADDLGLRVGRTWPKN
jgi:hypothetical protein